MKCGTPLRRQSGRSTTEVQASVARQKPDQRFIVAAVYVASMLMNTLDSTIVIVALATLGREFNVPAVQTEAVVVAYLVSKWRVGAAYAASAPDLMSFAETAGLVILASAVILVAREPTPWLPSWIDRRGQRPKDGPGVLQPATAGGGRHAQVPRGRPPAGGQHLPGTST